MSQRDDSRPQFMVHPRTGELLSPIGTFGGRVVWPVLGAADEGENAGGNNDAGANDGNNDGGAQNANDGGNNDGGSGGQNANGDGERTYTQADIDQITARMQAADRRASNFENELKKLQDASKTEQQRKDDEHAAAVKEAEKLRDDLRKARIGNAFFAVKGHNWHDPSDALDMLMSRYLDGVEIDDSGKVVGIDAAVKKMAKDKPYLIQTETNGSTATDQMNGKRKGQGNEADQKARDAELMRRFPSMQRGARS